MQQQVFCREKKKIYFILFCSFPISLLLYRLQRSTMLFPSNHQDLATEQRRFLQKSHSLLRPHSPPCLHPPHPSFSPRFRSPSPNLSPAPVSLHHHRTVSWVPSRRNLPKPCWRTTKSRRPTVLKSRRSVKFTASCSRSRLDPPCRHSSYTHIRPLRAPLSWCRRCTRRLWQHPSPPWRRDTAQATRTCGSRSHIHTRRRHSSRRGWPCSRRYNRCNNINNSHHHATKQSLSQQVRYLCTQGSGCKTEEKEKTVFLLHKCLCAVGG